MASSPPTPTVLDYFEFSYLAYQLTGANSSGEPVLSIPAGWVAVASPSALNPNGMTAVAFVNTATKQIVIAYRGSVGIPGLSYDWLVPDSEIGQGTRPQEFSAAETYASSLENSSVTLTNGTVVQTKGYTLSVTGHSLGGAEAEDVAAKLGIGGATFAGPGVSAMLPSGVSPIDPNFVDYVNQLDGIGGFVAKSGSYVGPSGKDVVLPATGAAIANSTLFLSGNLASLVATVTYHTMSAYGQALVRAGLIAANPLASSPPSPLNLGDVANSLQNIQTSSSGGSATESGKFSVSTSGGTVTGSVSETFSSSGALTLTVSEKSGTQTASQTLNLSSTGSVTSDNVQLDNTTITSPSAEPAAINSGADGSLLIGIPSSQTGDETTIVDNANGAAAVMLGGDQSGAAKQILAFAAGGLSGDTLAITEPTASTDTVTVEIANGDTCEVSADVNQSSVTQDFEFLGATGVLKLDAPTSFVGRVLGFVAGDTIDLAGIGTVTGATLGTDNVLAVQESGGQHFTLQLDPEQNFSGERPVIKADGSGGTDISLSPIANGTTISTLVTNEVILTTASQNPVLVTQTGSVVTSGAIAIRDVVVSSPVSITNDGTLSAVSGTYAAGATTLVTNLGKVVGTGDGGIAIGTAGTIVNGNAADISASITGVNSGVSLDTSQPGSLTVTNYGSISAASSSTTVGADDGIFYRALGTLTVDNLGTINGKYGITGQALPSTVAITNGSPADTTASIMGSTYGIWGGTGTTTSVSNFGHIVGSTIGVLANGATINNSGTIAGTMGIELLSGSGTIVNAGTIESTTGASGIAIQFGTTSRLMEEPGSVIIGQVVGTNGTLELGAASTGGSIGGIGNSISNFATVVVDASATWTLTGSNTIANFVNSGLASIANGGSLDVSSAVDPSSSGTFVLSGKASLEIAKVLGSTSKIEFLGASPTNKLTVDSAASFGTQVGSSSYAGPLLEGFAAGDIIDLKGISSTGLTPTYSPSSGDLQITGSGGSALATLAFQNSTLGVGTFHAASDGAGGTLLTHS